MRALQKNLTVSKLMAATGLYYLHQADYRNAAEHFAKVAFELGNTFIDVRVP